MADVAYRSPGGTAYGPRWNERLPRPDATTDSSMATKSANPGSEDRNEIAAFPPLRDKATDSPDDYPDEKEA